MKKIKSLLLMCALEAPNSGGERTSYLFLFIIPLGFVIISMLKKTGLSMNTSFLITSILVVILQIIINKFFRNIEKNHIGNSIVSLNRLAVYLTIVIWWVILIFITSTIIKY